MKNKYFYILLGFVFIIIGSFLLRNWTSIVYLAVLLCIYIYVITRLLKKLDLSLDENDINMERFKVIFEHLSSSYFDNVLEADITNDRLIGENSKKLTQLLNIPYDSSYSKTIEEISVQLVSPEFSETYRKVLSSENVLKTFESGRNTIDFECIERSDGKNYAWIRVHYCIYKSKLSGSVKIISYVKNIQNEKSAYERLMENSRKDQMTGFLNKVSTKEVVSDLLMKNENQSYTLLMIDIDNFKNINDTYGHIFGDEVIVSISKIIEDNFKEISIIGRVGGDEFLVCLLDEYDHNWLKEKLNKLLKDTLEYTKQHLENITLSIGVVNSFGNKDYDQLYYYADVAMYKAKEKGKNQYHVYDYTAEI